MVSGSTRTCKRAKASARHRVASPVAFQKSRGRFKARVRHWEQHRPVAFQGTSGRDARGRLTPRPQVRPRCPRPGESKQLGITCVQRQGGWSRRWGVCPSCPWGEGGPSGTRLQHCVYERNSCTATTHTGTPSFHPFFHPSILPAFLRDTPQAQRSVARHVCHTSAHTAVRSRLSRSSGCVPSQGGLSLSFLALSPAAVVTTSTQTSSPCGALSQQGSSPARRDAHAA